MTRIRPCLLLSMVVALSAIAGRGNAAPATVQMPATVTTAASAASAADSAAARAQTESGEAQALASAGASQLALKLIDASQPPLTQSPAAWAAWERTRLDILSSNGKHAALFQRIGAYPDDVPSSLRHYADQVGARAALGADDPSRARHFLRSLIWSAAPPSGSVLAGYQRLILRSYVVGGDLKDAEKTLTYLRRGGAETGWRTREVAAEVALQDGRPRQAVHLLSGLKQPEVRPLMLLAELGANIRTPRKIDVLAERLGKSAAKRKSRQLEGRFARVRAAAAKRYGDTELRLEMLARALRLDPLDSGPFKITPASFWKTLATTGLQLGNARRLLLGEAQPWLHAAAQERASHKPMRALALLAAAGTRSPDAGARGACLAALAKQLMGSGHGTDLALNLFADKTLFPHPGRLPGPLRYELLEPAVSAGRIPFASSLVAGLEKPPQGVDAGDWQIQRARLLLLGGHDGDSTKLLLSLAQGHPQVPAKKLLPVVVDAETVGDDGSALKILQTMLATRPSPPPKQARQILYWIGKAYSGLGSPLNAARAYLEAATFNSPYAMDQWAKTARYSAASALTQAGLYADAQRIYKGLLNATSDPTQQAQIKQKLAAVRTLAHRAADQQGDGSR